MSANAEQMKAMSVRPPWAGPIMRGENTVEFRPQPTMVRGRVFIYTSPAKPEPSDEPRDGDLPRGMVIDTAEVTGCEGREGQYEWLLQNSQRPAEPMAPKKQPQLIWGPDQSSTPSGAKTSRFAGFWSRV